MEKKKIKSTKVRIRFTSNNPSRGIIDKKVDKIRIIGRKAINYVLGELYDGNYSMSELKISTIDNLGRERSWGQKKCENWQNHMNEPDDKMF